MTSFYPTKKIKNPLPEVAIAIIYQHNYLLLQLRDELPDILYPGHWALFGGHIEPGETPATALQRELVEEIDYFVPSPQLFRCYNDGQVIRHVYAVPLVLSLQELTLKEGFDFKLVSPQEIRNGCCYSHKANQFKPLGKPHQKILLDFLTTQMTNDK